MNAKLNIETGRKQREEADFIARVGTTLATWGLGVVLLVLTSFDRAQVFILPAILLPVSLAALVVTLVSSDRTKRVDASHIQLLATAGCVATVAHTRFFYFHVLAACLIVVNARNLGRHQDEAAPVGVSALFVAWLAPSVATPASALAYTALTLALTVWIGRHEKRIAVSSLTISSTLIVLDGLPPSLWAATTPLALAHVAAVSYLKHCRRELSVPPSERRIGLDDFLIFASLSVALKPLLPAHCLYLFLGCCFALAASLRSRSILADTRHRRRFGDCLRRLAVRSEVGTAAAFGTFGIAMMLAVRAWPLNFDPYVDAAVRAALYGLVALLVFRLGRTLQSEMDRDVAKIMLAYALWTIWFTLHFFSSAGHKGIDVANLAAVASAAVAALVCIAASDLSYSGAGAWQTVFSGRALVRIRRTRTALFEILSKAPLFGWMFGLADKAATKLGTTFGEAKTWTLSHYSLCISIFVGYYFALQFASDALLFRLPAVGIEVLGRGTTATDLVFKTTMVRILCTFVYSSGIYWLGALFKLEYLRILAMFLAGFALAVSWFLGVGEGKDATSGWFFLLALCCVFAMFRVVHRR